LSPLKKISKGKSEGSTEDLLEKDNWVECVQWRKNRVILQ
jgi:hypothetical protein